MTFVEVEVEVEGRGLGEHPEGSVLTRRGEQAHARTIQVASGAGAGPTELAAFDAALRDAGIANFNLIYLSSVIPPGSDIEIAVDGRAHVPGAWGDRLYLVVAEERSSAPGTEAWAGIGWVQHEHDGRGLFVEHHGHSEAAVRSDIERSLAALSAGRDLQLGPEHMAVRGVRCDGEPVCALVAAVFEAEPWGPGTPRNRRAP